MVTYRLWMDAPPPDFARFWYWMLEECDLLGSGVVEDWEERLTEHFTIAMETGQMQWFVALEGSKIVGTCAAFLTGGRSNILKDLSATLAGIYVLPEHRKRGIARELTVRAIAWCKDHSVKTIRLQASRAGRPLYESLGFVDAAEMMRLDLRR